VDNLSPEMGGRGGAVGSWQTFLGPTDRKDDLTLLEGRWIVDYKSKSEKRAERREMAKDLLDRLAEVVSRGASDEFEVGRLAYELSQLRVTWRDMGRMLAERGLDVSYSWLHRLGTVYHWWVDVHGYSPSALARWSKTKLYYMAKNKVSDISLLERLGHLSDSTFISELRKELGLPPSSAVVSMPPEALKLVKELTAKLSDIAGTPVRTHDALIFALEVVLSMDERALRRLWAVAHGEYLEDYVAGAT